MFKKKKITLERPDGSRTEITAYWDREKGAWFVRGLGGKSYVHRHKIGWWRVSRSPKPSILGRIRRSLRV